MKKFKSILILLCLFFIQFQVQAQTSDNGFLEDIFILNHDGSDYNISLPIENNQLEARYNIAKNFYEINDDVYDFLVIFTNFQFDLGETELYGKNIYAKARHYSVKNTVKGIGREIFDDSILTGSQGKLLAIIDMGPVSRLDFDLNSQEFNDVIITVLHEIGHQWLSYIQFKDEENNLSDDLLGYQNSHWSFLLDSQASIMLGTNWEDDGNNTFLAVETSKRFSELDLYLMGFIPSENVGPFILIENSAVNKDQLPFLYNRITGFKKLITIDSIIQAKGERNPSFEYSQKYFKTAFVLLTGSDGIYSEEELEIINNIRISTEIFFNRLTGGKAVLETRLTNPPDTNGQLATAEYYARQWILNNQDSSGCWRDSGNTKIRDTIASVDILNPRQQSDAINRAGFCIRSIDAKSTGALVQRLAFLKEQNKLPDNDNSIAKLYEFQNIDKGWGLYKGYKTNISDTALSLIYTEKNPDLNIEAIFKLISMQNNDGGFNFNGYGKSQIMPTVFAAKAISTQVSQT